MNKSKIVAMAMGFAIAIVPMATVGQGMASLQKATITILTYAVGGPPHVKGPRPIGNVVVRVRSSRTGAVIQQIKETGGRATVAVRPGDYQVEAKLATLPCTSAKAKVDRGRHIVVKIYCTIR